MIPTNLLTSIIGKNAYQTLDFVLAIFDYRSSILDNALHSKIAKIGQCRIHSHKPNKFCQDNWVCHEIGGGMHSSSFMLLYSRKRLCLGTALGLVPALGTTFALF